MGKAADIAATSSRRLGVAAVEPERSFEGEHPCIGLEVRANAVTIAAAVAHLEEATRNMEEEADGFQPITTAKEAAFEENVEDIAHSTWEDHPNSSPEGSLVYLKDFTVVPFVAEVTKKYHYHSCLEEFFFHH